MPRNPDSPENLTIFRPIQNQIIGKKASEVSIEIIEKAISSFPSPLKETLQNYFITIKKQAEENNKPDTIFPPLNFQNDKDNKSLIQIDSYTNQNNRKKYDNGNIHNILFEARKSFSEKVKQGIAIKKGRFKNYKLVKDKITYQKLLKALSMGNSIGSSCAKAGIPKKTYYNFIEKASLSNNKNIHFLLYQLEHARELGTAVLEDIVHNHTLVDPATARWMLSKRNPDEFGENKDPTVIVNADNSRTVNQIININELPPEEQKEKLEQVEYELKQIELQKKTNTISINDLNNMNTEKEKTTSSQSETKFDNCQENKEDENKK